MILNIQIQGNGLEQLINLTSELPGKLSKELAIVCNKTAKAHRKEIGKTIRDEVVVSAKVAIEPIRVVAKASATSLEARLKIDVTSRPSLKAYGARQKKKGVSYRISKKDKRKTIKNAFIVGKLGGHVFKRTTKKRFPILKLKGPSVAAVYQKNNLIEISEKQIEARLDFEAKRRVRAILVSIIRKRGKKSGLSTDQINQEIKSKLG